VTKLSRLLRQIRESGIDIRLETQPGFRYVMVIRAESAGDCWIRRWQSGGACFRQILSAFISAGGLPSRPRAPEIKLSPLCGRRSNWVNPKTGWRPSCAKAGRGKPAPFRPGKVDLARIRPPPAGRLRSPPQARVGTRPAAQALVEATLGRELEVLKLLVQGCPDKQIAGTLVIAREPVHNISRTSTASWGPQTHRGRRPRRELGLL